MRRSRLIMLVAFCVLGCSVQAANADSVCVKRLEQELRTEIKTRERLERNMALLEKAMADQSATIDSLRDGVEQNAQSVRLEADQLGVKIDETNNHLEKKASSSELRNKTMIGLVLMALIFSFGLLVYFLLRRRIAKGNADVEALRSQAELLNEKVLNKFSVEMDEMRKIASSLAIVEKNGQKPKEVDHSLILSLADRITFMEMTLYKMDPKVKGHKQLTKSISSMKDNLMANGYEMVDMLGTPYVEGMKVIANFVEDEELELGKQIITGIIKPQINYQGKMIQAAQITVSQNL